MKNRETQAVSIWGRGRWKAFLTFFPLCLSFSFSFLLVEFKMCFVISILNIWFHKGKILLWNSATGMRQGSVSEWSKSGQTEAACQWSTVQTKSQWSLRQDKTFWISQVIPETCWPITTQRACHPHSLWNTEILWWIEDFCTSPFSKRSRIKRGFL